MKRRIRSFLLLAALIAFAGCGRADDGSAGAFLSEAQPESAETETADAAMQTERDLEALREEYPEYFEISDFKGIEVYVWETADGAYRCGMMSGTNRMKTASEIQALEQRALSVTEAKTVLEALGVAKDGIIVIPITQPYAADSSDTEKNDTSISGPYRQDEEHAEQIYKLFTE